MSDTIIRYLLVFLSSGIFLAIVQHILLTIRSRRDRRDDFRGFLGRWYGQVIHEPDVAKAYGDWLHDFWGYYGKMYRDFFWKRHFRRMCRDFAALNPEQVKYNGEHYRPIISEKIQALIDYV